MNPHELRRADRVIGIPLVSMTTRRCRVLNRLVTTAFVALVVTSTSACASTDNDRATDANAQDTVSPVGGKELTGRQFDVYRDPG